MLPVYKAISFQGIIEKGGRTKPWLILVKTDDFFQPFVVKVFETQLIETRDSVMNEVLGNILASQFGLPVPKAALIDFDQDFVQGIRSLSLLELLQQKDDRLKFGSELLEGYVQFNPSLFDASEARDIIPIDSVFAFDVLIRNADRNQGKPNLLTNGSEAFMIDHEVGFEIDENTIEEVLNWQIPQKFFKYHLFYNYIRASWKSNKEEYFNEFEECLKYLNVELLKPYLVQLYNHGFSPKKHNLIIDYLSKVKANSANFANLLKGLI